MRIEKILLLREIEQSKPKKSLISDSDITKIKEAEFEIKFLKEDVKKKVKEFRLNAVNERLRIARTEKPATKQDKINKLKKDIELIKFKRETDDKILELRIKILALSKGFTIEGARTRIKFEN